MNVTAYPKIRETSVNVNTGKCILLSRDSRLTHMFPVPSCSSQASSSTTSIWPLVTSTGRLGPPWVSDKLTHHNEDQTGSHLHNLNMTTWGKRPASPWSVDITEAIRAPSSEKSSLEIGETQPEPGREK